MVAEKKKNEGQNGYYEEKTAEIGGECRHDCSSRCYASSLKERFFKKSHNVIVRDMKVFIFLWNS